HATPPTGTNTLSLHDALPICDQRQRDDKPGEVMARIGQDRQDEADEAVRSDLQRDGGEDDRAAGWRLDVRVGQPGVHWPHRHLEDRKSTRLNSSHLGISYAVF